MLYTLVSVMYSYFSLKTVIPVVLFGFLRSAARCPVRISSIVQILSLVLLFKKSRILAFMQGKSRIPENLLITLGVVQIKIGFN